MARVRVDVALVERGLAESRAKAQALILAGLVYSDTRRIDKAGDQIAAEAPLAVKGQDHPWVSRGGLKLVKGLDVFVIDPTGLTAVDVGASTGGFTDVLLTRGAAKVYAVDVGHDQLHQRLRGSDRVVSLEGVNARDLDSIQIPDEIDLLVSDVSFVSVTKVLAAPLALCRPGADAVILIKPQFEVGRENIGKGGIVTDAGAIEKAIADVIGFMTAEGWTHRLSTPSPISGGDGNTETVAVFRKS